MQDTLTVRVKDILTLLSKDSSDDDRKELEACIDLYLPEDWQREDVVEFNEGRNQEEDVVFYPLKQIFFEHELPYIYLSDNYKTCDMYVEHYNKNVSDIPTKAYKLQEQEGYAISGTFVDVYKNADAETFKKAAIELIRNPFVDYPPLIEIED